MSYFPYTDANSARGITEAVTTTRSHYLANLATESFTLRINELDPQGLTNHEDKQ